jgi:hypothetical protein
MKTLITYYLLALAVWNLFMANSLTFLGVEASKQYEIMWGALELPGLTELAFACRWWAYVVSVVAVFFFLLSCFNKISSKVAYKVLFVLLIIDVVCLFLSLVGYCSPISPQIMRMNG